MEWKQDKKVLQAYEMAKKAQANAYAPYSKFQVGACFMLESGEFFSGCNMENVVMGASICAEINAMGEIIKTTQKRKIQFLVVVVKAEKAIPPCGVCQQVLWEFIDKNTPIYLANLEELQRKTCLNELMPHYPGSWVDA